MDTLTTERMILRPFTEADAAEVYAYAKNPNVGPNAGWKPHADINESKQIIRDLFIKNDVWAMIYKDTGKLIGSIGFDPDKRRSGIHSRELGYSMEETMWGQGLMTEAAKTVIAYGFEEMRLDIIAICTGPKNLRSQSVINKCGFIYEGTERRAYKIFDGSLRDVLCFSLLREEWMARK